MTDTASLDTAPLVCMLGDVAWDIHVSLDTELQRGGDTLGSVRLLPGGSAANAAVWSRRAGARTHFIGKVGTDEFADLARANLADEDVATTLPVDDDRPTGSVAVLIHPDGERSMVSGVGADFLLTDAELPDEVLADASHLHVTGWSFFTDPPRSAAVAAWRQAQSGGATVSFDPSSFQMVDEFGVASFVELVASLRPDLVLPNRDEVRTLTGIDDPEAAGAELRSLLNASTVVVKLGGDGALICDGRVTHVPTTPREPLDTTGAGDSFAGTYIAATTAGVGAAEAARRACLVAGWVVSRNGARPAPDETLTQLLDWGDG